MKTIPLFAALLTSSAIAADLDFYKDVYPFLKTNCISCHNKTTTKADLNMETPELMIKGGEAGPALVPGKSAESLVVAASLHTQDMEMPPPNNKSGAVNLTPAEIAILKQWIDQGAKASVQQERAVVLKAFSASVDPIYSVAMTKDGRYAACGRSNQIYLYDLATRQFVAQISDPAEKNGAAHRALVQSLSFSPDGTKLASGSFREVKIWKLDMGKADASAAKLVSTPASADLIKKITTAGKVAVLSSAMSADGKQVVTGCADGSVRIWDTTTAKQAIELRGSVAATKKTAELDWIIAALTLETAFQKSEIARIDAQDKALDVLLGKAKEAIVTMGKVLPEKQKLVPPTTEAKTAAQKAVDELAAKLAAAKDAAIEKELKAAQDKLITAKMTEVSALAAVSAAESNVKDAEDDVKRITDSKATNAKAVAAANAAIAAAKTTQDKAAADLSALKLALTKTTVKPIAVSFSADAQRVASMFEDGTLRVWAAATGTPIEESSGNVAATTTITAAPDGTFVATKAITQTIGSTPRWTLERKIDPKGFFADRVNAVRFSPDGKTLATGGGELSRSGDVIIFDVATGKATQTWKEKHTDTVLCLDFSPDGKRLATGAADKIARVTDIASGKQVNLFEGHTHHVMSVAFRSDGRVLATAGADGVVSTWNMIIGERKKKIEGWTKEVTSLQFIGATNQIVTSAGDNRVRIVTDDGAEVRAMANLPDYMQAAVSVPNGSAIIAGGEDSLLRVWDAAGKELVAFGSK
jgi:WD40 repeat protein